MKLPNVNCQYGAPMGRQTITDGLHGHEVVKCRLFHMQLDSGGYDNGGAYWGHGQRIYCAMANNVFITFRADDRTRAAVSIANEWPDIKFKFHGLRRINTGGF